MLKSIFNNSLWNLCGTIIPSFLAIPIMGVLSRELGVELFGMFTITFMIVGFANIFDVGLTKSVVLQIARNKSKKNRIEIISSALAFIFPMSLLAFILVYLFSSNIVEGFSISLENKKDVENSIKIISFAIPPLLMSNIILAYFEGIERFDLLNKQKIIANTIMSISPLFCFFYEKVDLSGVVTGVVISRFITLFIFSSTYYFFVIKDKVAVKNILTFKFKWLRKLLKFGGWLAISNIISPIMVYMDRLILSSYTSATTIAFYTAPAEIVSRMLIIPNALSSAIFPKMVKEGQDRDITIQVMILISALVTIITIPIFIYSESIMVLWMGESFSGQPAEVLKILIIGLIATSASIVPYTKIQSMGYSKITAAIHLLEIIPYLFLLKYCVNHFGVIGAAYAWSIRLLIDFILIYISFKYLKKVSFS